MESERIAVKMYTGKPVQIPMIYLCAHCGRKLSRKWKKLYQCRIRKANPSGGCKEVSISQREADRYVVETVRELCNHCIEKEKLRSLSVNKVEKKTLSIPDLSLEKERIEKSVIDLYKKYQSGRISKDSYLKQRKETSDLIEDIDRKIAELQSEAARDKTEKKVDYEIILGQLTEEFDPYFMAEIIDKVIVYSSDRMEIVFKNEDAFRV